MVMPLPASRRYFQGRIGKIGKIGNEVALVVVLWISRARSRWKLSEGDIESVQAKDDSGRIEKARKYSMENCLVLTLLETTAKLIEWKYLRCLPAEADSSSILSFSEIEGRIYQRLARRQCAPRAVV